MYIEQPQRIEADKLFPLCGQLDLSPGPGGSRFSDSASKIFHPFLRNLFPQEWKTSMVMALQPSAQIVAHIDTPINGSRYHVPLTSNPGCWAFHDGTWQQLEVGHVYLMDPTLPHGAVNWGATIRLSLVIDLYA